MVQLAMTGLAIAAMAAMARLLALVGARAPGVTLALVASLPPLVAMTDHATTLWPHLIGLWLVLGWLERLRADGAGVSTHRWRLWGAGVLTGAVCLVEPSGIALWVAAVAWLMTRAPRAQGRAQRTRHAVEFSLGAIAIVAIARLLGMPVAPAGLPGGGSAWAAWPSLQPLAVWVAGIPLALAALATLVGWVARWRRGASAMEYAMVCYLVTLALGGARSDQRIAAILPMGVYYIVEGGVVLGGWWRSRRTARVVGLAIAALWLAANASASAMILHAKRSGRALTSDDRSFAELHLWAAEHLPPGAVLASDRPAASAFISHRHAVSRPSERATHLVAREDAAAPDRWRVMTASGAMRLYEVVQ
jgi:hypothetical protein